MSDLKKKQHYVWRKYLRAWANDDSIFTFLKKQNKVINTGLMKVAQEKYFYELVTFTEEEEKFLENFITYTSPELVRSLNMDFLHMFTSAYKLKKRVELSTISNKEFFEREVRKIEVNLMEDAHCIFENFGTKLTNCKSFEDTVFLNNEDDFFAAIMFICIQYLRTKKMKLAVQNTFADSAMDGKKFWNIISFTNAAILANSLAVDPTLKFLFF